MTPTSRSTAAIELAAKRREDPFHVGPHAAADGPFTILRYPEPGLPDLVYLEQLNSALYLDQPDYVTIMDQLCVQAETGAASKNMLRALLKQT